MRSILLAAVLLLSACSKGGLECEVHSDCPHFEACVLGACVSPAARRDMAPAAEPDLADPEPVPLPDLDQSDLTPACSGPGKRLCNGVCVDTQTDEDNCGGCGSRCFGAPQYRFACCAGECVGTSFDARNCGMCGRKCDDNQGGFGTCCDSVCTTSHGCPKDMR